jgi:hypothetical protein
MIFAESEISDEIGNSASDRHDISEDGEFLLGDRADISVDMKSAINEISEKAREERRLAPDVMANLVLDLCAVTALSAQELARLLGRSDDYVRSILRPLVSSGKLGFLHPERPTHREQRYVTVSASARAVAYEAPEQP